jgi:hypothetical protein
MELSLHGVYLMLSYCADIIFSFPLTSEGQDEYEKDGFIVDDIEEEEEHDEEERAESDEERQKKKKRKKKLVLYPLCSFRLC